MAINLALSLTLDGKDAFWDANNTGINLDITHLQFGSRNRLTTGEESYLNQPKQAVKIQNGRKIGPEQVRIMATMPGIENYNIAEIGLWSGDPGQPGSILVAYTSVRTGFIAQMVTGIDLVFTYDMVISTADIDRINIIKDTGQSSVLSLLAEHELDRGAHPYYVTTDTEQVVSGAKTFTDKAIFLGGLTGDLAGNAFTASKLAAAILIGGVSFDGSAAINLPGVNIAGNQNTSGNAATASKLAAARTISLTGDATGSLSFDGSANASAAVTLANTGIAAGTYKSVTIDAKGRATAGNDVVTGLVTAATAAGTANLATSNTNTFLNITEKVGAATASAGTSTQITGAGTVTVASDAAGKITITGAQSITGNAATATKLQTPRAINGVNFDGSANITIADSTKLPTAGGTITGNLTVNGFVNNANYRSNVPFDFRNAAGTGHQSLNTGGLLASDASADASKVPTNGIYSKGNIETAGTMKLGSPNLQVVTGSNYTVTYDYATRIAQIKMKILSATSVDTADSPFVWEDSHFIARITLPITLKKRLYTELFFDNAEANFSYYSEAMEWLIWNSPAGHRGATDNLVVLDILRWTGSRDEKKDGYLIVTGFF